MWRLGSDHTRMGQHAVLVRRVESDHWWRRGPSSRWPFPLVKTPQGLALAGGSASLQGDCTRDTTPSGSVSRGPTTRSGPLRRGRGT